MNQYITKLILVLCAISLWGCGKPEKESASAGEGLWAMVGAESGSEVSSSPRVRGLISSSDYDSTQTIRIGDGRRWTLPMSYSLLRGRRNNSFSKAEIMYRRSGDAVGVRRAISGLGGATASTSGLNTYSVASVVTLVSARQTAGTYYIYFKYTTNGEDVLHGIYKLVMVN